MKTIKFFALAGMLAFATTASAQFANTGKSSSKSSSNSSSSFLVKDTKGYNLVSFGYSSLNVKSDPKYGLNNYFDFDFDSPVTKLKAKGMDFSYIRGINLTKRIPLFLEVGGMIDFNTWNKKEYDYDYDYEEQESWGDRINCLSFTIPVNVSYKFSFRPGFYVAPYSGFHFKLNLLAKDKYTETEDDEEWSETYNFFDEDDCGDYTFNRFQFGGQFGVNTGYKNLNLGIGYYWDTPLLNEDGLTLKTGGVKFTVGYIF